MGDEVNQSLINDYYSCMDNSNLDKITFVTRKAEERANINVSKITNILLKQLNKYANYSITE